MPNSVKFEKLKKSYLFILIPTLVTVIISGASLLSYLAVLAFPNFEAQEYIMNPIIAGCYLLAAISLSLVYFRSQNRNMLIFGRIFSGLIFSFSLITVIEFNYSVNLGIAKYLYYKIAEATPLYDQYLTVESCIIFILLGVSILCNSYKPFLNKIAVTLNAVVFLISLVAVMGYFFGVEEFYSYKNFSIFSISSALCALSLAIAGFFSRPIGSYFLILMSTGSAGIFARRVSIACLLLPPTLGKIGLYFSNSGFPEPFTYAVVAILCLLTMVGVIWKSSTALELVDRYRIGSEQEKVKSVAQMDAILSKAPIGIAFFGMDGSILRANQIFIKYLLKNSEKNNLQSLSLFKNELKAFKDKKITDLVTQELPGKSFEVQLSAENGSIYLNINFFSINSSAGELMGLACSFVEITHLKEIEKELILARDIADSSNNAKSQFLANMSHEIRTPIGVIMGFIDIIKDRSISEKDWLNNIAIIERSCRQLLNIIDDILDLSKVEAGKIKLQYEEVNIRTLIEDLKSVLELRTADKQITFEVKIQVPLPEKLVSDNTRMRQVILNICGNAIKFTKQGKVILECFAREKKLFFRVIDQGCGIPADQLGKLFKPFSQVDSSVTREFGGNGLGLALSQRLAKALGGDVIIEKTEENVGSVFLISFDMNLALETGNQLKRRSGQSSGDLKKEHNPSKLSSKKVLVVDDSPDNRLLISHLLKAETMDVVTAKDGKEGYDKAKENKFDLILLDLQMPIMGGYETAKKLREEGFDNPIVALTAHAMIGEKENCLNAGFDDYLTKPIDKNKLLKILKYNFQDSLENSL